MLSPVQRAKIRLFTEGVDLSPAARTRLCGDDGARPLTLADYASTSGITLRLEGDVWVNAPMAAYNPNFVTRPGFTLDVDGDALVVHDGHQSFGAVAMPVPDYHAERNQEGEAFTTYAHTHSDRVRISPVEGCAITCEFCDLPYEYRYRAKRTDRLVDAVGHALRDRALPARHVLISGGTPRRGDYAWLKSTWRAVVEAFPGVEVDVMMVPMPGLVDPVELAEMGVHGLSINLEMWNAELAMRVMPSKARLGRNRWLQTVAEGARIFGPGRVRSLLLVGIEPLADTLAAVEALAERGCDPVLSPFRPDPSTPMRDLAPPSVELLEEAWEQASEIVARHGVRLGPRCVPCMHNTLTFPGDS